MTDREMVMMAVLEGSLPASMLSDAEVAEMEHNLFDLIADQHMIASHSSYATH